MYLKKKFDYVGYTIEIFIKYNKGTRQILYNI